MHKINYIILPVILLLILSLAVIITGTAAIDPSTQIAGPSGYEYLGNGHAINNTISGDTILANSSTSYENISASKQITINSIDIGSGQPIVDGQILTNSSPYSVDYDLRNDYYDSIITASDIEAYIQANYPNSPMLSEANIGNSFINAGITNDVDPAFLVATAELEGKFGTEGWAASHPGSHNTMGYGIPSGDTPPDDINSADSWGVMVNRVASTIAHGSYYYTQGHYTVNQIRSVYASIPNSQTIVNMMNALYLFGYTRTPTPAPTTTPTATYAYIANYADDTVSVIDIQTNMVTATFPVGSSPHGVAVNPTGTNIYITNVGINSVSVINAVTNTVTATIPVESYSFGVAVNPAGTNIYVTNAGSNNISVINTATNTVTAVIPVGEYPWGVTVNPMGTNIYVTNLGSNTVSVIDETTKTVTATIQVGSGPRGVAVNPDGTNIYVTNYWGNTVSVIDMVTNTVTATIQVGSNPYEVAVNPAGTNIYVTNEGSNTVSVIDAATNTVTTTIPVGIWPHGVAVNPTGTGIYVTNIGANPGTVSVIDAATNTVTTTTQVGKSPDSFGQFIIPSANTFPTPTPTATPTPTPTPMSTPPIMTWQNNYGGTDSDFGYSVQQTTDGGYIITGGTNSFGNGIQVYLVKTDSDGTLEWQNNYGGTDSDGGYSVQQTTDGGYIIAGCTDSFGNGRQVYLVKTDSDGTLEWQNNYGGTDHEEGYSVQQTTDGGYIIVGRNLSSNIEHVYLVKTSNNGTLEWQNNYGGTDGGIGQSVQQTSDGGYIITGYTSVFANWFLGPLDWNTQVYLVKTSSNGTLEWQNNYGINGAYLNECGYSVRQTSNGGYIIAGSTQSVYNSQVYLIKTRSDGTLEWQNYYGGTDYEEGWSVLQTTDGGYIAAGRNSSSNSEYVYLVKTSSNGTLEWQNNYGELGNFCNGHSIQQTIDGGYIITGITNSIGNSSQVYLIKVGGITYSRPIASFYSNRTSGIVPLNVRFTDKSINATLWDWDFDNDGVVDSTQQNPVHVYPTPGNYTVKLTVYGPGGSDEVIKQNCICVVDLVHPSIAIDDRSEKWIDTESENDEDHLANIRYQIDPVELKGDYWVNMEIWDSKNNPVGTIDHVLTNVNNIHDNITWDGTVNGLAVNQSNNSFYVTLVLKNTSGDVARSQKYRVFVGRPVIFVHGLTDSKEGLEKTSLYQHISKSYYTESVEYVPGAENAFGNIIDYSTMLRQEIDRKKGETGAGKVDIVSHSMGGLISRCYIQFVPGGNDNVGKLIMIGTPNHGSEWAGDLGTWATAAWADGLNYDQFRADINDPFSAIAQMRPHSQFLTNLNGADICEYEIRKEGAQDNILYKYTSKYIVIASNESWVTRSHGQHPIKMGILTQGDGVVPYYSAQLSNVALLNVYTGKLHLNPKNTPHGDLLNDDGTINHVNTLLSLQDPDYSNYGRSTTAMEAQVQSDDLVQSNATTEPDTLIYNTYPVEGVIYPQTTEEYNISVDDMSSYAQFIALWDEGSINVSLFSPNGTLINSYSDNSLYYYAVDNPDPGNWTIRMVTGNSTPVTGANVSIQATISNPLALGMNTDKYEYKPGDTVDINGACFINGMPITGAIINAVIYRPDNLTDNITLYDDGAHNDNTSNDGIYGNTYNSTNVSGIYEIVLSGTGIYNNRSFERYIKDVITVQLYPDLVVDPTSINFSNETPITGEIITINATIINVGETDAVNVSTLFYDGLPADNRLIGQQELNITAGQSINVSTTWYAISGKHDIYVAVGVSGEFMESDYSNNIASNGLDVNNVPVSITLPTQTCVIGDMINIPFVVYDVSSLSSYKMNLDFDDNLGSLDVSPDQMPIISKEIGTSDLTFSGSTIWNLSDNVSVAILHMNASKAGIMPLNLTATLRDYNGVDVPVIIQNGSINIVQTSYNASYMFDTIPDTMIPDNCPYNVSITVNNTGTLPWSENEHVRLAVWGENAALGLNGTITGESGYAEYVLPEGTIVYPGQEFTWQLNATPSIIGNYWLGLSMVKDNASPMFFGPELYAFPSVEVGTLDSQVMSVDMPELAVSGRSYTVNVTIHNNGTAVWAESGKIRLAVWGNNNTGLGLDSDCASESGYIEYSLPAGTEVMPGENYTWHISMTPDTEGGYWVGIGMVKDSATPQFFGEQSYAFPYVWQGSLDATIVSYDVPDLPVLYRTYTVNVTMHNDGSAVWTEDNKIRLSVWGNNVQGLGMNGDCVSESGYSEYMLPAGTKVMPGENYTWQLNMTPDTEGGYWLGSGMVKDSMSPWFFGEQSYAFPYVWLGTLDSFVEMNYPELPVVNQPINITVTARNNGSAVWSEASKIRLAVWGNDPEGAGLNGDLIGESGYREFILPAGVNVYPGQSYSWFLNVTPTVQGGYWLGFGMVKDSASPWFFGSQPYAFPYVWLGMPDQAYVSDTIPGSMTAGQTYHASITFRNTGSAVWAEASKMRLAVWGNNADLGLNGNCTSEAGYAEYTIPGGTCVMPGQEYTWQFDITPTAPGTYWLGFSPMQDKASPWFFGPETYKSTGVTTT